MSDLHRGFSPYLYLEDAQVLEKLIRARLYGKDEKLSEAEINRLNGVLETLEWGIADILDPEDFDTEDDESNAND